MPKQSGRRPRRARNEWCTPRMRRRIAREAAKLGLSPEKFVALALTVSSALREAAGADHAINLKAFSQWMDSPFWPVLVKWITQAAAAIAQSGEGADDAPSADAAAGDAAPNPAAPRPQAPLGAHGAPEGPPSGGFQPGAEPPSQRPQGQVRAFPQPRHETGAQPPPIQPPQVVEWVDPLAAGWFF
ncbi:MAG: hypothetical protein K6T78_05570 [Alicyclobacillus sp.]|nr:hypothetical protein [Alicyclobacillus sp.]